MKFNDLVSTHGSDIFYKRILEIKKEIEIANKTYLSEGNDIPPTLNCKILNEPVSYCFAKGKTLTRDYNDSCKVVNFYYEYEGSVILSIRRNEDGMIDLNSISDCFYKEFVWDIINKMHRNSIIDDVTKN